MWIPTTYKFDQERHRLIDDNGRAIPNITSITGVIDKSRFLIPWAVNLAKDYLLDLLDKGQSIGEVHILEASRQHTQKKQEAMDIGSLAHEWIEKFIKGQKPGMPKDEKVRSAIIAFLDWQKGTKIKWLESEKKVLSKKYGFWGILDAVAKIGGKLVLIDFKSSKGIYPEYNLQSAAYQLAYEEETKKEIDHRIIAKLGKENGEFEIKELSDYAEDRKAFLGALELKRRLDEIK